MKKLRMIVVSIVILAIVSSAFAFIAKKTWKYCYSSVFNGVCEVSPGSGLQRVAVGTGASFKMYYVPCWEGTPCTTGSGCSEPGGFLAD